MQTTGEMKTLVDSFNKMAARLKEQKEAWRKPTMTLGLAEK